MVGNLLHRLVRAEYGCTGFSSDPSASMDCGLEQRAQPDPSPQPETEGGDDAKMLQMEITHQETSRWLAASRYGASVVSVSHQK